jgi:acetyltransferase-like isoleucine patch superfamily enzyme
MPTIQYVNPDDETTVTTEPHKYYEATVGTPPDDTPWRSSRYGFDMPGAVATVHARWVMDGVDDLPTGPNPVDQLGSYFRDRAGFWATTPWGSTGPAKDYLSALIMLKRYYLASVPPPGAIVRIVRADSDAVTGHDFPLGSTVRVLDPIDLSSAVEAEYGHTLNTSSGIHQHAFGASFGAILAGHTQWIATNEVAPWWEDTDDYDGSSAVTDSVSVGDRVMLNDTRVVGPGYIIGMTATVTRVIEGGVILYVEWDHRRGQSDQGGSWSRDLFLRIYTESHLAEPEPEPAAVPVYTQEQVDEAMRIISEVYQDAATSRNWCREAEEVSRLVNSSLRRNGLPESFAVTLRKRTVDVRLSFSIQVPVTRVMRVEVDNDYDEDTLIDAARVAFNDDTLSASEWIEEFRDAGVACQWPEDFEEDVSVREV